MGSGFFVICEKTLPGEGKNTPPGEGKTTPIPPKLTYLAGKCTLNESISFPILQTGDLPPPITILRVFFLPKTGVNG